MAETAPLVEVDRNGSVTPISSDWADFHGPRLSPDGERIAVTAAEGGAFILWSYDIARGRRRRLTQAGEEANDAVWVPNEEIVVFASRLDSASQGRGILAISVDGSGETEVLLNDGSNNAPHSWSPDGQHLAYYRITVDAARDIWILPRGDEPQPFIVTDANERSPSFSPDGRWIAYVSDETGRDEVYVTAFPGPRDTRKVSTDGGRVPVWSRDGTELFYRNGTQLLSVPVQLGQEFVAGEPEALFEGSFYAEPGGSGTQDFDVTPDGQRFVMIQFEAPTQIRVIQNWFEELTQAMER
jgi:Tol biopolymer transport system component